MNLFINCRERENLMSQGMWLLTILSQTHTHTLCASSGGQQCHDIISCSFKQISEIFLWFENNIRFFSRRLIYSLFHHISLAQMPITPWNIHIRDERGVIVCSPTITNPRRRKKMNRICRLTNLSKCGQFGAQDAKQFLVHFSYDRVNNSNGCQFVYYRCIDGISSFR